MGRHVHITSHTGNTASDTDFMKILVTFNTTPIVNYDAVYDSESMGRSIIFSIHNALYFKGMNHNLIPPFIIRLDVLEVDECPNLLACNPTMRHHFILLPDQRLCLPLHIKGIISYLPTMSSDSGEEGKLDRHIIIPIKQSGTLITGATVHRIETC